MDMSSLWIKNTSGKIDAMLTFSVYAFFTVLGKVVFGGNTFDLVVFTLSISPIDPAMIAALLAPTLGAYVARRNDMLGSKSKQTAQIEKDV